MTDLSAIALGRGNLRLVESTDSNQVETGPILSESDSVGQAEECALNNELEFSTKRTVESISAVKRILTRNDLFIDTTILNASKENLRLLFTGKRIIEDSFYLGGIVFNTLLRIEIEFVYPNKVNTMTLVIPKAQIVSTSDFNLVNLSEPSKPAFTFQSLPIDDIVWNKRLGRIVFQ